jgi:hypothetical protein
MKKKGAVQARRPCPPLAKAPQRLALPPGSLVCNDRRKGDRRAADLMVWREAMALRAFGSKAVELPPTPAGRTCRNALGRYRPLSEDGGPACDASGSPDYGVATNTCRTTSAASHNGQDRTAGPLRGCQWILLVPRITRTMRFVGEYACADYRGVWTPAPAFFRCRICWLTRMFLDSWAWIGRAVPVSLSPSTRSTGGHRARTASQASAHARPCRRHPWSGDG